MATSSEAQPLKKRKLYETPPEPPSRTSETLGQPESSVLPPSTPPPPPPLSQEEIFRRRRNRDEIRGVYEIYKRLKSSIALKEKDSRYASDLDQAYFALINASGGCLSVQRIVADFIPRYASYCPSSLLDATKVLVSMLNRCLDVINRGEDVDFVAFQTAKACIFGFADICRAASSVAQTPSVSQGSCTEVFYYVLSFLVSSFQGKDLLQIVDEDILRMKDSDEIFLELKQRVLDENVSTLVKLSKFCVLSLVRILFCCPSNLLGACFELVNSSSSEVANGGLFFLKQVTSNLCKGDDSCLLGKTSEASICSPETSDRGSEIAGEGIATSDLQNCLLGQVLGKNPSLKTWMFSKYKKLLELPSSKILSEIIPSLGGIFESLDKVINVEDSQAHCRKDDLNLSRHVNRQSLMSKISNQVDTSVEKFGGEKSCSNSGGDGLSGQHSKPNSSVIPNKADIHMNTSSHGSEGSRSTDFDQRDPRDSSCGRSSVPRDHLQSPVTGTPSDSRSNQFEGRTHFPNADRNQVLNMDCSPSASKSSSTSASNPVASPNTQFATPQSSTSSQMTWYFDGDPAAMGVYSASRQLWLGSLGPDVSESHIRYQLERFAPLHRFSFYPATGFALAEYHNIVDAIKTREYIRGCFPWRIKFMDVGLGTRGIVNGVAVGTTSFVYVGNISSQWARDEIIHESRKVAYKGPYTVTDFAYEGALLMEFETPEEAVAVMAHLRNLRRERSNQPQTHPGPNNVNISPMDGARPFMGPPHHVDISSSNSGNMAAIPMDLASPRLTAEHQATNVPGGHPFHSADNTTTADHALGGNMQCMPVATHGVSVPPPQHIPPPGPPQQMQPYGPPLHQQMPPPGPPHQQMPPHGPPLPHMPPPGPHPPHMPPPSPHPPHMPPPSPHPPQMPPPGPPPPQMPPPCPPPLQIPPPQQMPPPYMRPVYHPPNSPWDPRGSYHHFPQNPISPGVGPGSFHGNVHPPPFASSPMTPVAQAQGPPVQQYDQMFSHTGIPPQPLSSSAPPPLPAMPPPLPPTPPPLPHSMPPAVPPPPNSPPPPPPPVSESSSRAGTEHFVQNQWEGSLGKSGLHYCTVYAQRLESDLCSYTNSKSEPTEWPTKLDMTKRTDFRHVKSTFSNTPPHKREVCKLIPCSRGDLKGFQDYMSYLKQRECAGVIKIPAANFMWSRLLFILPFSDEICSLLSIPHDPSDCLVALVLPKETNFDL